MSSVHGSEYQRELSGSCNGLNAPEDCKATPIKRGLDLKGLAGEAAETPPTNPLTLLSFGEPLFFFLLDDDMGDCVVAAPGVDVDLNVEPVSTAATFAAAITALLSEYRELLDAVELVAQ